MKTLTVLAEFDLPAQMLGTSDLARTRKKNRTRPPIFNVSEATIWRWVREGILPKPVQVGGKSFWHAEDIAELLRKRHAA
jgi:hypothetical protein